MNDLVKIRPFQLRFSSTNKINSNQLYSTTATSYYLSQIENKLIEFSTKKTEVNCDQFYNNMTKYSPTKDKKTTYNEINKEFFIKCYNAKYKGQKYHDNINDILGRLYSTPWFYLITQYAYILATIKHETAHTFDSKTVEKGQTRTLRGRGFVQLSDSNYEKYAHYLNIKELNPKDENFDPDIASCTKIAWHILEIGVYWGLFLKGDKNTDINKLSDYNNKSLYYHINENKTKYYDARDVINSNHDKADVIKGYAENFEKWLSKYSMSSQKISESKVKITVNSNLRSGVSVNIHLEVYYDTNTDKYWHQQDGILTNSNNTFTFNELPLSGSYTCTLYFNIGSDPVYHSGHGFNF